MLGGRLRGRIGRISQDASRVGLVSNSPSQFPLPHSRTTTTFEPSSGAASSPP